jgi:L-lactate dehydrogenase complex protein LldF
MLRDVQQHSGNVSACTLCLSCQTVCPVKIDLGDQIYKWRQQLDEFGTANPEKKLMCMGMNMLFGSPSLYRMATAVSPIANIIPPFLMNMKINPWAEGHQMMTFPKETFHSMWKKGKIND